MTEAVAQIYDDALQTIRTLKTSDLGGTGPQGLSAYEVAVENGFVGTEEDWLDSLVGQAGESADVVSVATSRSITASDDGKILDVTADGVTLTVPNSGLDANFACGVIPTGTTTVASAGTALINGATTSITRTATNNKAFCIQARSTANSYIVTGV